MALVIFLYYVSYTSPFTAYDGAFLCCHLETPSFAFKMWPIGLYIYYVQAIFILINFIQLFLWRKVFLIKEISQKELKKLIKAGVIKNSNNGFVNTNGYIIPYKRTVNKRYIQDEYLYIAQKL